MLLYMSGPARNDIYETIENRFCSHRLFSMYRSYVPGIMKWLESIRDGVLTVDDFLRRDPFQRENLADVDRERRERLRALGDEREWQPLEDVLRSVCASQTGTYPKSIMLDSGAFTAWKSKKTVPLDQVRKYYTRFLERSDGLFDQVWLINLDVITDDKMTDREKKEATDRSDENFAVLRSEFGNRVLPVFHQGEGVARLRDVIEQADDYLYLSPNNDLSEDRRWRWACLANYALRDLDSTARAHGLATTGNVMVRKAGLYSGDSATWIQHAKNGRVVLTQSACDNIEVETTHLFGGEIKNGKRDIIEGYVSREIRKGEPYPQYRVYHISNERNDRDRKTGEHLLDSPRHFTRLHADERQRVVDQVEGHGFPFVVAQQIERVRALISMAELDRFASLGAVLADDVEPIIFDGVYDHL